MRTRTTHKPVSEAFRRSTIIPPRTQLRPTDNGIFALGMLAGIALTLAIVFAWNVAAGPELQSGDRVCVEYTDADGYFCGPVVVTEHGVFRG